MPERVRLERFDRAERVLHRVNAALFGLLMATGAVLYLGPLATLVGNRHVVRWTHVVAGLVLPLPLFVARYGPWRHGLAADAGRLARFDADDRRWARSLGRDPAVRLGKFHPGQKVNAAFTVGAIAALWLTGAVMHWYRFFPVDWRTGATFTHDWLAVVTAVVVAGHVRMAVKDPDARRAMRYGWVTRAWARRHRPRWYEEMAQGEKPARQASSRPE
ncbi:MAG: cytochrome b/b6 domain-containing protein [Acidimicrobiia bacterium]